jgi:1,2-phenylacetyl-CoA epoxidase catalytic subunit
VSSALNEEALALLRKIVEGQAYRQLMLANIRGHGIKFLGDLEAKIALAEQLELALRQFREVQRLYAQLCDADVVSAVRGKMERIPYPASRLELGLCLFLCQRVERAALLAYTDSASRDLAAVSLSRLEAAPFEELPQDPLFVEFCQEVSNRPHAQQLLNRWVTVALLSLGRPGSHGDARAVALKLRSRRVAEIVREFLAELQPFIARCHLALPDAAGLGLEFPAEPAAR